MKRIRMLQTRNGSENGFIVTEFAKGKTYEVCDELADAFMRNKDAIALKDVASAPEQKVGATK